MRACGEYCDVVSINFYESGPLVRLVLPVVPRLIPAMPNDPHHFKMFNTLTGRPVMVTEFSFRAKDSGLPNTYPPGLIVQPNLATQADRGRKYDEYVSSWASEPYFVGWHWFQLMDQPKAGRGDGERAAATGRLDDRALLRRAGPDRNPPRDQHNRRVDGRETGPSVKGGGEPPATGGRRLACDGSCRVVSPVASQDRERNPLDQGSIPSLFWCWAPGRSGP